MSRFRKISLSIGCAALLAAGAIAVVPRLLGQQVDAHVASIKLKWQYQDPKLLEKAWQLPVASLYHANIEYQHNPSFCGPTSIANVLHSTQHSIDQDAVLQDTGVSTVLGFLPSGVTLDELAGIARRKTAADVTVLRDLTLQGFREQLQHVNDVSRRYVINFTRATLFGTGGGHHSPIAGYLAAEDLVLILDVNKNYGSWLVKPERLYEAMNTTDGDANKKRGILLIELKK